MKGKMVRIWHNKNMPCYFYRKVGWKPAKEVRHQVVSVKTVTEVEAPSICDKFNSEIETTIIREDNYDGR